MSNSPRHPSRLSQYSEDSSFYPRELTESGGILYFIDENGVATPLNISGSTTLKDASGNIIGTIQPRLDGEITIPDATGSDKGLVILSDEAAKASGTSAAGSSSEAARADHVHPKQTTITGNAGSATKLETSRSIGLSGVTATAQRFDGSNDITIPITAIPASIVTGLSAVATSGSYDDLSYTPVIPVAGTTAPVVAGTAEVGISEDFARADHVHPAQTTITGNAGTATKLASKIRVGLSGVTAIAQDFDGGDDIIIPITAVPVSIVTGLSTVATSGKYSDLSETPTIPVAGTSAPKVAGTVDVGTSEDFARADHVHPAQTTITGNAGTATKLSTPRNISINGAAVSNSKSFDGTDDVTLTISSLDASAITGVLPLSAIPKGAQERLIPVPNETARQNLTADNAQNGDVVKVEETGIMYYITDDTKLGTSSWQDAYSIFTAGAASSVAWSGITNKPSFAIVATSGSYDDLSDKPTIPVAGVTTPVVAGVADAGTSEDFARADHVHPAQTSVSGNAGTATKLASKISIGLSGVTATAQDFDGSGDITIPITAVPASIITDLADVAFSGSYNDLSDTPTIPWSSSNYPKPAGTAAPGVLTNTFARVDHVHPAQTTITGNAGTATEMENIANTIANEDMCIWFSKEANYKKPFISAKFKYNPRTDVLTVGSITGTAGAAVNDENGNPISSYVKSMSVSGNIITYTKGDGTSETITTQDTAYDIATDSVAGIAKLYTGTGSNTDGSMTQSAITSAIDTIVSDLATVATSGSYNDLSDTPIIPVAGATTPVVAGTAKVGTSTAFARADHVHPAQTSITGNAGTATKLAAAKTIGLSGVTATAQSFDGSENITIPITAVPASIVTGLATVATSGSYNDLSNKPTIPSASSTTPKVAAATAVIGSSANYARADHVHPAQTSVSGNAGTATKLASAVTIDGVEFDGSTNITLPTKHPDITLSTDSTNTATASAGTTFTAIDSITKDDNGHVTEINTTTVTVADNVANGFGFGTCATDAEIKPKVALLNGYALKKGSFVSILFRYAVPAGATININNTGVKSIYDKGSSIKAGVINAGDIATFVYTGGYYCLVSVSSPSQTYLANIGTTWSGDAAPFTQTITVAGMTENDNPIVDVIPDSVYETAIAQIADYGKIYKITTASNIITVYATEVTTVEVPIQLKCVK